MKYHFETFRHDGDYADWEFGDDQPGAACRLWVLSYCVPERRYYAALRTSENAVSEFGDGEPVTDHQLAGLIAAIPSSHPAPTK